MWIVKLALRRPYTVATLCLCILLTGVIAIGSMLTDVLPAIDIPVVIVVWNFPGLTPEDIERRVNLVSERGYSTTVNGIEHMESEAISGTGIIRVFFESGVDIGSAIAQITSSSLTSQRIMPPGMQPPVVLQFNASNVTVAQLTVTSDQLSQQQLFDWAQNFLRLRLFTIPGLSTPVPYGGSIRQVSVDLDPERLAANHLSAQDVVNAISNSNVILPAGTARIGKREYDVTVNGSPNSYMDFNRIPIKVARGATVYLGDVALTHDGNAVQQNSVRVNGRKATYLAILKKADASTLKVIDTVRAMLPDLKKDAPPGIEMRLDFDQSVFVRGAVWSVLREALISAALVALMVLGFLGSWRSVVIVCTSIPLAILFSVLGLKLTGQTFNLMTLGGLALSIGMLVDDATVEVENIHRNRRNEPRLMVAILDSASQVAIPALATTLTICIVFSPVILLTGPAKYLFIPLALAVVFAMLASYLLSRTLVPAMSRLLMAKETDSESEHRSGHTRWQRFNGWRDRQFERLDNGYAGWLKTFMAHRVFALALFGVLTVSAIGLAFVVGLDFFPRVDTGLMKLHFRGPPGTRIEDTEVLVGKLEQEIRGIIPAEELQTINDNVGVPLFYNLAFVATDNVNGTDADVLIQLQPHHHAILGYMQQIREKLGPDFPGSELYFQAADVVGQVLNFGLSAPLDLQVQGHDLGAAFDVARKLESEIRAIPGATDVRIAQSIDHPTLEIQVDRERAALQGLFEKDIATSLLTSLSGSSLSNPSFFLNPDNHVNYNVVVQTPIAKLADVNALLATPVTGVGNAQPGGAAASASAVTSLPNGAPGGYAATLATPPNAAYLGSLATIVPTVDPAVIDHYTIQPVIDVQASAEGRDLGSVAQAIHRAMERTQLTLPKGMELHLRGQSESMFHSFKLLGLGLFIAIALVYLLLVTLLQSWLDPFVIMLAIPGALVGVLWMLVLTGTTLNVESMMGAIMVVGIAVSNSNLLVNFANDVRADKQLSAIEGAIEAGKTRLRPVLMTALAMLLGMLPMAFAIGEGGEQNAPLGRAVIGGLLVATFVTLLIVPVVYSLLRTDEPQKQALDARFEEETAGSPFGAAPAEKHRHSEAGST